MTISASGNVGIQERLHTGTGLADARITISNAGTENTNSSSYIRAVSNILLYNSAGAGHRWEHSGGEKMRIHSNGYVGIGTQEPDGMLSIKGANDSSFEIHPDISSGVNRITNFNRLTSAYKTLRVDALEQQFYISGNPKLKIFNTVVASEVDVSIKSGKRIELQTTSGVARGYITAQESNSSGEAITFKDAGVGGTTNMVIDGSGDVSMPYKAYAYGQINGNPTSITNNYGSALTTTASQNCTPQTNSGHGPGITITKAGFYILNMSCLYDPGALYIYLGWAVNGSILHHWHSNHAISSNHDAVSQIGRYLNIGDHVSIENASQTISTIYGNAHSSWYIAKIG